MESKTLQQVIRQYVQLPPHPSTKGWYPVLHTACDRGHKGPRAAWKFDGDVVGFNCFNCSIKTKYDPALHEQIPKKMIQVLKDFNIPEDEWNHVVFTSLSLNKINKKDDNNTKQSIIEPKVIQIPDNFQLLTDVTNNPWKEVTIEYLKDRKIDHTTYPFMLSKHTTDPHLKKWLGRIIIPVYKNGNVIFYQGRDLTGTKIKKYESPPVGRDNVIFGFDELFKINDEPLYIVEGVFDALSINCTAIFGNSFTEQQIKWFNRSNRKKVYIPDKFGKGYIGANQALEQGWYISTPDFGGSVKDINEAIIKYGKLYVLKTLSDNISTGFEAQTRLRLYCK